MDETGRKLELCQSGALAKTKYGDFYFKNQIDDYKYRAPRHEHLCVYMYFTTLHKTNRVKKVAEDAKLQCPHPLREFNTYQMNRKDLIGVLIGPN